MFPGASLSAVVDCGDSTRPDNGPNVEEECWVRMPPNHQRLEGLNRGSIYELIAKRLVVSISLRRPGAARGIRLVGLRSLRGYLARLAVEQNVHHQRKEACE
jgi:hypothetical protein